jgi:hypothetical protein
MMTESITIDPLVALGPEADSALAEALRAVPDLNVVEDAPSSALVVAGSAAPLETAVIDGSEIDSVLRRPREHLLLLLIQAVVDDATGARLEDAGIAFVDAASRAWLPGQPRSRRARRAGTSSRGPKAAAIRVAQLLADRPGEEIKGNALAERAETTPVTVHRLLTDLEQQGLVERRGRTRSTIRRVTDVVGLRRWLLRRGRPSTTERLSLFVPDPAALPGSVGHKKLVLTGGAAAAAWKLPVMTSVPRTSYRVDATGEALEALPAALGGFRTDQGANVVLISDTDHLALNDARHREGAWTAPPSRVMLDLYLEPRGEAAADVFLDLWGSKELE